MSRDSEKIMAAARKYLREHGSESDSIEDMRKLPDAFVKEYNESIRNDTMDEENDAYYRLERADETESVKERNKYLKNAEEPDNLDVQDRESRLHRKDT